MQTSEDRMNRNVKIFDAIEKTLKDWGIDWILEERGDKYQDMILELKLAISKVY